jgi:hypothetical protein
MKTDIYGTSVLVTDGDTRHRIYERQYVRHECVGDVLVTVRHDSLDTSRGLCDRYP